MYSEKRVTSSGSREHGEDFHLNCTVSLRGKLNAQLLETIKLKWEGPPDVAMTAEDNVTIGDQIFSSQQTTLQLSFGPLSTNHAGMYRCIASSSFPSFPSLELHYNMVVTSESNSTCMFLHML